MRRARAEHALLRPGRVTARVHAQHIAPRAIEPGKQNDLITRAQAAQPSRTSASKASQAGGAPSSGCLGADSRSVSEDSTLPIGLNVKLVTFVSCHIA
jgi:hypothetical protein